MISIVCVCVFNIMKYSAYRWYMVRIWNLPQFDKMYGVLINDAVVFTHSTQLEFTKRELREKRNPVYNIWIFQVHARTICTSRFFFHSRLCFFSECVHLTSLLCWWIKWNLPKFTSSLLCTWLLLTFVCIPLSNAWHPFSTSDSRLRWATSFTTWIYILIVAKTLDERILFH